MDKYDYRILLEEISLLTSNSSIKKKIHQAILKDKPYINSVFGIGEYVEFEEELCIFISDKTIWQEEGHCGCTYTDDAWKILKEMGCSEVSDCIYVPKIKDVISLTEKLIAIGFEHDTDFEFFMMNV